MRQTVIAINRCGSEIVLSIAGLFVELRVNGILIFKQMYENDAIADTMYRHIKDGLVNKLS